MRDLSWTDIAQEMVEQADFDLTLPQAKAFVKKALVQTTHIIKNSKGKIMFRNCDLLQIYKDIDWEALKAQRMDTNEVQEHSDRLRVY